MPVNMMPAFQSEPQKKGKLDTVAQAVDIASKVLGTGIDLYNAPLERRLKKADTELKQEEVAAAPWRKFTYHTTALDKLHSAGYRPIKAGEKAEVTAPEAMGGGGYLYDPTLAMNPEDRSNQMGLDTDRKLGFVWVPRIDEKSRVSVPVKVPIEKLTKGEERNVIQNAYQWRLHRQETSATGRQASSINVVTSQEATKTERGEARYTKKVDDLRDRINAVKDPIRENIYKMRSAQEQLKNGGSVGDVAALGMMARGLMEEKGPLSDSDIKRLFPNSAPDRVAAIKGWLTGDPEARLTDAEKAATVRALLVGAKQARRGLAEKLYFEVDQMSSGDRGFFENENVKSYMKAIEREVPGIALVRKIGELNEVIRMNQSDPAKVQKAQAAIKDLEGRF